MSIPLMELENMLMEFILQVHKTKPMCDEDFGTAGAVLHEKLMEWGKDEEYVQ